MVSTTLNLPNMAASSTTIPNPTFSLEQAIIILSSIIAAFFILLIVKKIYFRYKYNKRYYLFPKISISGITNIAMIIAIATAIIILLTIISSGLFGILFRAYPSFRVNIEAILVKIGGLIFGPVLGIFIGAFTDILTVLLTAGMFHYGYFVACIMYGFISGLLKSVINLTINKNKYIQNVKYLIYSTICLIITGVLITLNVGFAPPAQLGDKTSDYGFGGKIFGTAEIVVSHDFMTNFYIIFFCCCIVINFILFILFNYKDFKNILYNIKISLFKMIRIRNKTMLLNNDNFDKITARQIKTILNSKDKSNALWFKTNDKYTAANYSNNFLIIYMLSIITEVTITIFLLPLADFQLGGGLPYQWWLFFRTLMLIPMIIINIFMLYPVYKVIIKNFTYNYTSNISESRV